MMLNVFNLFEKVSVRRDEENSFKYSDANLFLTKRDQERVNEIYGRKRKNNNCINKIIPICLSEKNEELNIKNNFKINLVFLGSLNYPANERAIIWFLKNVWEKMDVMDMNIQFIIGGREPTQKLLNEIRKTNLSVR